MLFLEKNGYQLLPLFISEATLQTLQSCSIALEGTSPNIRKNVFGHSTSIKPIFKQIETSLKHKGLPCFMTDYCFYLSKSKQENWPLQFHQDINLPAYLQLDHSQKELWLNQGFWVRINLDFNDRQTGALKVIPQSHLKGKNSPFSKEEVVFLDANARDVILFSPLLYHGSDRMQQTAQRRVFQCFFQKSTFNSPQ